MRKDHLPLIANTRIRQNQWVKVGMLKALRMSVAESVEGAHWRRVAVELSVRDSVFGRWTVEVKAERQRALSLGFASITIYFTIEYLKFIVFSRGGERAYGLSKSYSEFFSTTVLSSL